ncbi:signal peptidase I [Anaerosporobacter sp.]
MSREENYSNDDFENAQSTVDVDTYENDPISALSEVVSSKEVMVDEVEEKGNPLQDNKVSKKEKRTSIIKELLVYIIIFFIGLYIIPNYVLQRTVVDGDSMLNTLHNEESLLIDKISYVVGDPKRFDIVVFYPYGKDVEEYYVKRVIGLPGETVQIIGQDIYINGEILEENYGKDPIHYSGIAKDPITLAEDEYFLMGDNREISFDSRYEEIGPVHRDYIEGKAFVRIWPLNKFGFVD